MSGFASAGAAGALRGAAAPVAAPVASGEAYFSTLRGAVVLPLAGRAWSLNPRRGDVPPSITVQLSEVEDAALLAALKGWRR